MNGIESYMKDLQYIPFYIFALFFLIEQIFYWFLGSYPYRCGLVVKTIKEANIDTSLDLIKSRIIGNNKASIKNDKLYIRYKYPFGVLGPLLFIGQIEKVDRTVIFKVKIGPASVSFLSFLVIGATLSIFVKILSFEIFTSFLLNILTVFINLSILFLIIAIFYFIFVNPIRNILKEISKNEVA